ncbi:MAG TPA: acyl-ACP thioesterase domain-containing protein [Ktedonobacterales bacterium]|nr:acyl-ACP thioesterase domain-containing protein [Ktedonobacterales bacterium]
MPDPNESLPVTAALTAPPNASSARHVPPEAWTDALTVRSYEAGRDGGVRPGVILRYLESLATRASAGLGFDNRWYRAQGAAWVVREMSLLLGARAAIDDNLRLATWVSDFRRVQATRDYLITRADTGRLVARAQARWAYIDRLSSQPTRIPDDLTARMGPWGHGMRPRRPQTSSGGLAPSDSLPLVAREYEADTQGHINNCVYLDWFSEAARRAMEPNYLRPRFVRLEYIRPALPGDALTIHTAPTAARSRGVALWQWIAPTDGDTPIARAWSEWLTTPAPAGSDATL